MRHAYADPGRYVTQSPQGWFSRGTAHIYMLSGHTILAELNIFVSLNTHQDTIIYETRFVYSFRKFCTDVHFFSAVDDF